MDKPRKRRKRISRPEFLAKQAKRSERALATRKNQFTEVESIKVEKPVFKAIDMESGPDHSNLPQFTSRKLSTPITFDKYGNVILPEK